MTKLRFLLLIVLLGVGAYIWVKGPKGIKLPGVSNKESNASAVTATVEVINETKGADAVQATVKVKGGADAAVSVGEVKAHYFTKEGLAACSTETVTRVVEPDSKYGHQAAGALVAQTKALPSEQREQYASALALGTRLLSMKISPEGVATADYNSALNAELNDCSKTQRRAQIERTLREFTEIKQVVITVQGEKWE